jgi:hypothetical protein
MGQSDNRSAPQKRYSTVEQTILLHTLLHREVSRSDLELVVGGDPFWTCDAIGRLSETGLLVVSGETVYPTDECHRLHRLQLIDAGVEHRDSQL